MVVVVVVVVDVVVVVVVVVDVVVLVDVVVGLVVDGVGATAETTHDAYTNQYMLPRQRTEYR